MATMYQASNTPRGFFVSLSLGIICLLLSTNIVRAVNYVPVDELHSITWVNDLALGKVVVLESWNGEDMPHEKGGDPISVGGLIVARGGPGLYASVSLYFSEDATIDYSSDQLIGTMDVPVPGTGTYPVLFQQLLPLYSAGTVRYVALCVGSSKPLRCTPSRQITYITEAEFISRPGKPQY